MVALNIKTKPSSASRTATIFFIILIPLVAILSFIYDYYYLSKNFFYWYIIEFIFCVLWIIFYPKSVDILFKAILIFKFKKLNFEYLTVELSDEGITKSSTSSTYKFEWNSVLNIISTKDHIFIYIKPNIGYSIPLSSFSSNDEKDSFTQYFYRHVNKT
nr:YcxB family protein [Clostridium yunnanense]